MTTSVRCEALTRRNRPCRNAALPQSDPPRCIRHRGAPSQLPFPNLPPQEPARQKSAPAGRTHRAATADEAVEPAQRCLPGFAPQGLDALELEGLAPDLQRELQEVRLVMYRLLRLWDDAEPPLPPEEARRLAALIFSGARTVAHLLNQQAGSGDARGWLKGALDQVAAEYGIDL